MARKFPQRELKYRAETIYAALIKEKLRLCSLKIYMLKYNDFKRLYTLDLKLSETKYFHLEINVFRFLYIKMSPIMILKNSGISLR
jgi:hypothetical protein